MASEYSSSDSNMSLQDYIALINDTMMGNWQQYINNRAVSDTAFIFLSVTYSLLIFCGTVGNGLVCLVVVRKPKMRTARNVFIINLAISDLLLCLFTMPFTLVEILLKIWPLGLAMCKLVSALQATSIFVSTMSITAIALDRYNVIIYPTREMGKRLGVAAILAFIWVTALFLSLPLFLFRTVNHHYVGLPGLESVDYCIENWPVDKGRALYSIASIIIQYILPIVTVSVAYTQISHKLKSRMLLKLKSSQLQPQQSDSKKSDVSSEAMTRNTNANATTSQKIHRTNLLLLSIAVIFGISWLPLNILNIYADVNYTFAEPETFRIVFASCHMMGMSSACSNPLLYGWLNENFRKEFKEVYSIVCSVLSSGCLSGHSSTRRPSLREQSVVSRKEEGNGGTKGSRSAVVLYTRTPNNANTEETTVITQALANS